MTIRRLPPADDALRRYAAEPRLPYHRDLAAQVDAHALADWPDEPFVERNVAFTRNRLEEQGDRGWVAATASGGAAVDAATAPVTHPELELTGPLLTGVDECPDPFDRPDRLVVGDLYVAGEHRGTGLADRPTERAERDAREQGCSRLQSPSRSAIRLSRGIDGDGLQSPSREDGAGDASTAASERPSEERSERAPSSRLPL